MSADLRSYPPSDSDLCYRTVFLRHTRLEFCIARNLCISGGSQQRSVLRASLLGPGLLPLHRIVLVAFIAATVHITHTSISRSSSGTPTVQAIPC